MPFAVVLGTPVDEPPKDLYIPPDALEVFLDAFEGPLDLLIYLIKKQNLDILDIPIAHITQQYTRYIDMMQALKIDLAAEYLVMAAMLRSNMVSRKKEGRANVMYKVRILNNCRECTCGCWVSGSRSTSCAPYGLVDKPS